MESCLQRWQKLVFSQVPAVTRNNHRSVIEILVFHSCFLLLFLRQPLTSGHHWNPSYQQECCLAHSPTLGRCWCPTAQRTEDPEKSQTIYNWQEMLLSCIMANIGGRFWPVLTITAQSSLNKVCTSWMELQTDWGHLTVQGLPAFLWLLSF